jgi:hypothetical protein
VVQYYGVRAPVIGHGWAQLDPAYWPVDVQPALGRYEHRTPTGTRLFNEYLFGGFVIYYTPGYRVLVDDRCELYGDRWLQEYVAAEAGDTAKSIREWERRYPRFDLALTRSGSGFDDYFVKSPEWTVISRTPTATFYERNTGQAKAARLTNRSANVPASAR